MVAVAVVVGRRWQWWWPAMAAMAMAGAAMDGRRWRRRRHGYARRSCFCSILSAFDGARRPTVF